jgi:hypothetical protein
MERQELKKAIERAERLGVVPEDLKRAANDRSQQFDYCPACLKLAANGYFCSCGQQIKTIFPVGAAW